MQTGKDSCCGKACTSTDYFTSSNDVKCSNNLWKSGTTESCGNSFSDGYCDCCPDCFDCVHPKPSNE